MGVSGTPLERARQWALWNVRRVRTLAREARQLLGTRLSRQRSSKQQKRFNLATTKSIKPSCFLRFYLDNPDNPTEVRPDNPLQDKGKLMRVLLAGVGRFGGRRKARCVYDYERSGDERIRKMYARNTGGIEIYM